MSKGITICKEGSIAIGPSEMCSMCMPWQNGKLQTYRVFKISGNRGFGAKVKLGILANHLRLSILRYMVTFPKF